MIKEKALQKWIGVDLDRTLTYSKRWISPEWIGTPIWPMIFRVAQWLEEGIEVRIITGRVASDAPAPEVSKKAIEKWTERIFGKQLKVQSEKGFYMTELWDDKAIQVVENIGIPKYIYDEENYSNAKI